MVSVRHHQTPDMQQSLESLVNQLPTIADIPCLTKAQAKESLPAPQLYYIQPPRTPRIVAFMKKQEVIVKSHQNSKCPGVLDGVNLEGVLQLLQQAIPDDPIFDRVLSTRCNSIGGVTALLATNFVPHVDNIGNLDLLVQLRHLQIDNSPCSDPTTTQKTE